MALSPGARLGPYEILAPLGAGGMGEVYRARDTRVERAVALKVLPEKFLEGEEHGARFGREARALASLNHPGIATLYSFEEIPGSSPSASRHVLVMELVEGQGLDKRLGSGPLPLGESLSFARQIAEALGYAHGKGILHRDLKPSNVMVTPEGRIKLLDFGLAKRVGVAAGETEASTLDRLTEEGSVFGTLPYMSPEQLLSKPLDGRSDLFSLGIVLWEMATGKLPFEGSSKIAMADAILHAEPRTLADSPVPEKLRPVVRKLLEKEPEKRYANADVLQRDLAALLGPGPKRGLSRNARFALAAAALVLLPLGGWYWRKSTRESRVRAQIPEITRLIDGGDELKAAEILESARAVLPGDATLEKLWIRATGEVSIETDPPGATVSARPYRLGEGPWRDLGPTPLKKRLPPDWYVYRVTKSGFVTRHEIGPGWARRKLKLDAEGSVPDDAVRVSGGKVELLLPGFVNAPAVPLDDYLIDRLEVTNEAYLQFVREGGYEKQDYWSQPLVRAGRTIPWKEAIRSFTDMTGRPGPATWEVGSFPKGTDKHPVAGVSWYEAAAFASWAKKSLPTVFHWNHASQPGLAMLFAPGGNFGGAGTRPAGGPGSLGGFGTADMAGNVKEWCWNESSDGKRFILGGGFGEPSYMFGAFDAQSPWDRRPNYGFRCVTLPAAPPREATAHLEPIARDYSKEKPVSDEVFKAYKSAFAYDRRDLSVKIEEQETAEAWTREKVSFAAAYGGERVPAHVFLPKNAAPPFQTVVFFPGSGAIEGQDKLDTSAIWGFDFVVRSGRALVFPVYKSTYERRDGLKDDTFDATNSWREHVIMWSKDLARTLDYIETRSDLDHERKAYLGFSWGALMAPMMLAVDERFQAAVLAGGGYSPERTLPEVDQINFVPRMKTPTLLIDGRFDFGFPVESSQVPFFRMIGTTAKDKKHLMCESGHVPPQRELVRETLDWLDKYLGPVKR